MFISYYLAKNSMIFSQLNLTFPEHLMSALWKCYNTLIIFNILIRTLSLEFIFFFLHYLQVPFFTLTRATEWALKWSPDLQYFSSPVHPSCHFYINHISFHPIAWKNKKRRKEKASHSLGRKAWSPYLLLLAHSSLVLASSLLL